MLVKVVDGMTKEDAVGVMQEAHETGVAMVLACPQVRSLQLRRCSHRHWLETSLGHMGSFRALPGDFAACVTAHLAEQ